MAEFLAMSGYAAYVWSAFGLSILVLIANVVFARRQFAAALRDAKRRATEYGS